MARIRTIKPEFFRHEALQDLEIANPGKYPMMVFEALWGHCDNKGRFEWKPRMLKLDILPFLPFNMAETLAILESAGMVRKYIVDGKEYGEVPTFEKHQRLSVDNEKRNSLKRSATPKWLSKKQRMEIKEFYFLSKSLTRTTGVKHNVDHVVPICGKTVCGLHVPWNLQVITEEENLKKHAKHPSCEAQNA